ncbi:DUF2948 family protein [Phenylobacterium sp.]|uniref:DUF2948 family protein n=1 Tax=Phenylobacterium sp. TaxID=1871053 RepID=UPI002735A41D|nr:DUF2948 family protein [Phenylobacterium sp.]MDP3660156.1 DUF2948 family protein [Phenylobacterium sp.]
MPGPDSAALRLLAMDEDDLAVISAALQDAVAKVGDIAYEPRERRLTIVFNRYRWESGGGERVRSALQLGGVSLLQARRIRRGARQAVVELLSVHFEVGDAPSGSVVISFAGGGDLRAEVECVDAILADISTPWPTRSEPAHET